ncbi:helix-turn-helix transcriptional regulator [Halobacterium yunchengense]|uniref:helix-turn-helix transcriptional regulator n=1 Tax=Halobacterium yunchengense TaxID=3108497 RepID=UPI0030096753
MGEDSDAVDVLVFALERRRALDALADGGGTRGDVEDALGVSRSTAHRVVTELASLDLAVRRDGRYELTSFGRVVAHEASRAARTVAVADRLAPLLETFEHASERIELQHFDDASVTTPEPGDPYRPMRRLLDLVEDAARVVEFAPTMPEPAYLRALYDCAQSGLDADVLYPPEVVDRLEREHEGALVRALNDGALALRVADVPAFRLVVADDRVYLGGYNEDASGLRVVADTDAADAVEWARACFRRHWRAATPYDAYRETE